MKHTTFSSHLHHNTLIISFPYRMNFAFESAELCRIHFLFWGHSIRKRPAAYRNPNTACVHRHQKENNWKQKLCAQCT